MNIVIIEDSKKMAATLNRGLREEGHNSTTVTHTATQGLKAVQRSGTDIVLLDLGLPDLDGVEVIRRIRREGSVVPILVLTARDAIASRVRALDLGADDYLVKPFAFEELLARLSALIRRASAPRWLSLHFGNIKLDAISHAVRIGDRPPTKLSPRQHNLLETLIRHSNEVVSRAVLLHEAFGYDFDPGTNLLDVHLSHLRKKLRTANVSIRTVRGAGLILELSHEAQ